MKVRELSALLEGIDPEIDVLCMVETLTKPITEGEILEIVHGGTVEAEKHRSNDGQAGLIYRKTNISRPHFILEVTVDF
jgi:hypothetical protein